jgi:ankyrin repeat protein
MTEEVPYEEQTDLYRQIGRKDWVKALAALEADPQQAKIWVATKYQGGALSSPDDMTVWYRRLPLHHACSCSNVTHTFVQALVDAYPQALHERDETGKVPLIHACRRNTCLPVVQAVLTAETAKQPDDEGKCALHWACEYRASKRKVQELVDMAPSVLCHADSYGRWPLHWECAVVSERKEQMQVVTYLVEKYPEAVSVKDLDGRTPLQMIDLAEVFALLQKTQAGLGEGTK